jgi:hypothetical protein
MVVAGHGSRSPQTTRRSITPSRDRRSLTPTRRRSSWCATSGTSCRPWCAQGDRRSMPILGRRSRSGGHGPERTGSRHPRCAPARHHPGGAHRPFPDRRREDRRPLYIWPATGHGLRERRCSRGSCGRESLVPARGPFSYAGKRNGALPFRRAIPIEPITAGTAPRRPLTTRAHRSARCCGA